MWKFYKIKTILKYLFGFVFSEKDFLVLQFRNAFELRVEIFTGSDISELGQ